MSKASPALGARVRLLREKRGRTAKALARQLGVDPAFFRRIERGVAAAPRLLVRDIAKELDVPEDPLLVLAGHLPEDVDAILCRHPEQALRLLRTRFGRKARGAARRAPR